MSELQKQNIIDIENIISILGETEIQTARALLIKLLDATLLAQIPEIKDLDTMDINKKIKLVQFYSLSENERKKIPYNEIYNDETIKTIEECKNGINVSKTFHEVDDMFKDLEN